MYIQRSEIAFFSNGTWTAQINVYLLSIETELLIIGNGLDNSDIKITSADTRFGFGGMDRDLRELGVEGIEITANVTFDISPILWNEASDYSLGQDFEFEKYRIVKTNLVIGTVPIE